MQQLLKIMMNGVTTHISIKKSVDSISSDGKNLYTRSKNRKSHAGILVTGNNRYWLSAKKKKLVLSVGVEVYCVSNQKI